MYPLILFIYLIGGRKKERKEEGQKGGKEERSKRGKEGRREGMVEAASSCPKVGGRKRGKEGGRQGGMEERCMNIPLPISLLTTLLAASFQSPPA